MATTADRPGSGHPTPSDAAAETRAPSAPEQVTTELLRELTSWSQGPCLSIYVPTHHEPPQAEGDRLTLRSALRDAALQLEGQTSLDRATIDRMLAPGSELIEGWQPDHRRSGHALFAAPGFWRRTDLGAEISAATFVAERFVVAPLLADLLDDDRHYVLALAQNDVRLFRGDRRELVPVTVPDLPTSRADALWYEDNERTINIHGGSHVGSSEIAGTLHGSPSDRDLRKHQVLRFFRAVDKVLAPALTPTAAPLVLAGVGYELAIYREATHYPHIAGHVETGNPERLGASELHQATWPTVAAALDAVRQELVTRAASSREQLTNVAAVLAACREGRVHALLVRPDALLWGPPDGDVGRADQRPGDVELVSEVVRAALAQRATVHRLARGELPLDPPIAAVSRF